MSTHRAILHIANWINQAITDEARHEVRLYLQRELILRVGTNPELSKIAELMLLELQP